MMHSRALALEGRDVNLLTVSELPLLEVSLSRRTETKSGELRTLWLMHRHGAETEKENTYQG
jgi:hypothetical protein